MIIQHDQARFISGTQGWFNSCESISVIQFLSLLFIIVIGNPSHSSQIRKRNKRMEVGKEEKLSLLADDSIPDTESLKMPRNTARVHHQ